MPLNAENWTVGPSNRYYIREIPGREIPGLKESMNQNSSTSTNSNPYCEGSNPSLLDNSALQALENNYQVRPSQIKYVWKLDPSSMKVVYSKID